MYPDLRDQLLPLLKEASGSLAFNLKFKAEVLKFSAYRSYDVEPYRITGVLKFTILAFRMVVPFEAETKIGTMSTSTSFWPKDTTTPPEVSSFLAGILDQLIAQNPDLLKRDFLNYLSR